MFIFKLDIEVNLEFNIAQTLWGILHRNIPKPLLLDIEIIIKNYIEFNIEINIRFNIKSYAFIIIDNSNIINSPHAIISSTGGLLPQLVIIVIIVIIVKGINQTIKLIAN